MSPVNDLNLKKVYLKTGDIYFSSESVEVKTLLGSCVCVCLWDSVQKSGGIIHFLLPRWKGKGEANAKYGDIALKLIYETMLANGSLHGNIIAKVFGGARLLKDCGQGQYPGLQNVETAKKILKELKIPVVAQDIGGNKGRKILFYTNTGEVFVRKN